MSAAEITDPEPSTDDRLPEVQAAFDALAKRLEVLPSLAAQTAQAFAPLEKRAGEVRVIVDNLQAVGAGTHPGIRAALKQGEQENRRQADLLWGWHGPAVYRRRQLEAIIAVQRMRIREFFDQVANQVPLSQGAAASAAEGFKAQQELESYLAAQIARWRPRKPSRNIETIDEILKVIPEPKEEIEHLGDQPPEAPADEFATEAEPEPSQEPS